MNEVYIGLGSNLQQPILQLIKALNVLSKVDGIDLLAVSRYYRSKAVGPDQPDFVNLVCRVNTLLMPREMLAKLKFLELLLGRKTSKIRWGPRAIDLDLIYWQGIAMVDADLQLPHAACWQRLFVLLPWLDVSLHDLELSCLIRKSLLLARPLSLGNGCFCGGLE